MGEGDRERERERGRWIETGEIVSYNECRKRKEDDTYDEFRVVSQMKLEKYKTHKFRKRRLCVVVCTHPPEWVAIVAEL